VTEPSPSQDPGGQAQSRARLRTLMNIRNAGGVIVFSAMAVLGVVGLATGHEGSGLVALVIGGPMLIVVVARLAGRKSQS
jgi:peptidoglycan/LPS O-acetylase OafA/YrhL